MWLLSSLLMWIQRLWTFWTVPSPTDTFRWLLSGARGGAWGCLGECKDPDSSLPAFTSGVHWDTQGVPICQHSRPGPERRAWGRPCLLWRARSTCTENSKEQRGERQREPGPSREWDKKEHLRPPHHFCRKAERRGALPGNHLSVLTGPSKRERFSRTFGPHFVSLCPKLQTFPLFPYEFYKCNRCERHMILEDPDMSATLA